MEQKYDVFISYSSKDKEVAYYVCNKIEEHGLRCWIAPRNEVGGISYARQILSAIGNCSVVVVCFSCHANKSDHVESEIDNAFSAGKVIIPFRLDECEMSAEMKYYLNKKHWQNGIPVNEASVNALIDSIIVNIPEHAKTRDFEQSVNMAFEEAESLASLSKDTKAALSMANDGKVISLLDRLKQIQEHILKIEQNIEFAQKVQSFIDSLPPKDKSRPKGPTYDILRNEIGELLIVLPHLKGDPENARMVVEERGAGLFYKNSKSALVLEEINEKAMEAFKKVDKVYVVELENDDVVAVYIVPVRIVRDDRCYDFF